MLNSVAFMVQPHQAKRERESGVAPLVSYIIQLTCHTKRIWFRSRHYWKLGTEPISLRFREKIRFRYGVAKPLQGTFGVLLVNVCEVVCVVREIVPFTPQKMHWINGKVCGNLGRPSAKYFYHSFKCYGK